MQGVGALPKWTTNGRAILVNRNANVATTVYFIVVLVVILVAVVVVIVTTLKSKNNIYQ